MTDTVNPISPGRDSRVHFDLSVLNAAGSKAFSTSAKDVTAVGKLKVLLLEVGKLLSASLRIHENCLRRLTKSM
jgi:hypothetical protein